MRDIFGLQKFLEIARIGNKLGERNHTRICLPKVESLKLIGSVGAVEAVSAFDEVVLVEVVGVSIHRNA